MNYTTRILFQAFVKPFYKENAGTFIFIFITLFYAVGSVDGAGLLAFHHSLALGMLKSNVVFLLVLTIWFFYARKCAAFVSSVLCDPHHAFLHIYNYLSNLKRFWLFFIVSTWLLMPILLYAVFIGIVGWHEQLYAPVIAAFLYLLIACIAMAMWSVYVLNNSNRKHKTSVLRLIPNSWVSSSYPFVLIRFIAAKQKFTWLVLKILTCIPLYLISRNNILSDSDIILLFLFFNFGILANGVLIYKIREFEKTYLTFYSGLPVSLLKRFLQYALVYFIVLLPEIITLLMLVFIHLQYYYAICFFLCSFSLLLLMNSISLLRNFQVKEYLKILILMLVLQYIFVQVFGFASLYSLFFVSSVFIFFKGYYKYEMFPERQDHI